LSWRVSFGLRLLFRRAFAEKERFWVSHGAFLFAVFRSYPFFGRAGAGYSFLGRSIYKARKHKIQHEETNMGYWKWMKEKLKVIKKYILPFIAFSSILWGLGLYAVVFTMSGSFFLGLVSWVVSMFFGLSYFVYWAEECDDK
jgi:hypothetical protein